MMIGKKNMGILRELFSNVGDLNTLREKVWQCLFDKSQEECHVIFFLVLPLLVGHYLWKCFI